MTKPEGPKRTLVGAPAPGHDPDAPDPNAGATTPMPQQLETTVPFGSSALRAALDAALAAGPQAVAAEVARLRQDAASGSSAAIRILEESGDDLAARMANPAAVPSGPDVATVAQDAMRIAAAASQPIDPRVIGANVPLDPRYQQQPVHDPRSAQQQHDPRYAQQQPHDPRYAQQQGSNPAAQVPDPRYSNPNYGSQVPDPRYSNPNYGSNPAAQVPQHDPGHGSNPAVQPQHDPRHGSNPAAQVDPRYVSTVPQYGSNPAAQVPQHDPGHGSNPAAQVNPRFISTVPQYGSNPAAQVPHYGSNPAAQVPDPRYSNPNDPRRPPTGPNPVAQKPGTDPNVAVQHNLNYGSNPAAQVPQHDPRYGSNPAAQVPQHYGSNPAAQVPQHYGSNPAAQVPQHYGSNPAAQVDPRYSNPNDPRRPPTGPNPVAQHPGTNPNVAAQRPGTDPNVAVQHNLHYGSNLPKPGTDPNVAAQHNLHYGPKPGTDPNIAAQHYGANLPKPGTNPNVAVQHHQNFGEHPGTNPNAAQHYGANPHDNFGERPGTNPNAVAQHQNFGERPGTNPNAQMPYAGANLPKPGTNPNVAVPQRPPTGPNPAVDPRMFAQQQQQQGYQTQASYGGPPQSSAFAVDGELRTLPLDLYEIGNELARGGMGRIIRARDVRLGRPVAIKELLGHNPAAQARFEREALITARLQHPAIVPIYEAGRWPTGELFFAMKMVAGKPLDQLIVKADTMRQRLALLPNVIAMAEALAYAHSNNVIHRDLKPANVLIGDFGETIVIDWGLAKDLSDTSNSPMDTAGPFRNPAARAGATVAGSVMGTPAYMPPEQGKGMQVDARADVYAIGALLYHVLAKQPPYDGPDGMSVLQKMLAAPPPPLVGIAPEVPPELATIVAKAMARDALERYPTARELVEDLRRYQNGQMVGVHRYSTRDLFKRWAKKHKGALVVAAAAFVLLVGGGIFAITRILDANHMAQQQRDEALANREAAVGALARAEDSEKRAKSSEQHVIVERDRQRFVRARRLEMDHFKHTQLAKCNQCHVIDQKTFTAKAGSPGHGECVSCHEAEKMEGLRDDPKCAYCHLDRKPTTKDQRALRACDDRAITALKGAGGKASPCFRHDLKQHRIDDKGEPLECVNCHGVLADKSKWDKSRTFTTLNDLARFTIIGQGAGGGVDAMHRACTTGCHAHDKQVDEKNATRNCVMCHPQRDKAF